MWPDLSCHDIIVIRGRRRLERRLGHATDPDGFVLLSSVYHIGLSVFT